MYKNQLQELAQRSCFNLPSYMCIREGPDHAPRFKAAVNFNGESFESPNYCSTLRQAEHSAAEVALNALANRGPSNSLAARILDETGVYKNLLQEVSQRVGASLPAYTTFRTGLGHLPVFTGTVELAGVIFTGEPAKNKKQAEKNAAMAAWLSLKTLMQQTETPYEKANKDEQEHVSVARALQKYIIKARLARLSFPINFPTLNTKPSSSSHHQSPATSSKILPLICPKTSFRNRPIKTTQSPPIVAAPPQKFPGAGAAAPPYIPVRLCNPHSRIAPPVTVRNMIPVFSAPPLPPPPQAAAPLVMRAPVTGIAPPVCVRHSVPAFAAPVRMEELKTGNLAATVKVEDPRISKPSTGNLLAVKIEDARISKPSTGNLLAVKIEDPLSIKSLSSSEVVPTVEIEANTVSKVSTPPHVASSQASSAEEASAAIDEGLKDLKI